MKQMYFIYDKSYRNRGQADTTIYLGNINMEKKNQTTDIGIYL